MIDGVIFDKDGTLFDFHHTWAAWTMALLIELAEGNHDSMQRLAQSVGFDLAAQALDPGSPVVAQTPAEIGACLLPHLPGQTLTNIVGRMDRLSAEATLKETVPLAPLVRQLHSMRLKLGVVTNDSEAPARAHLNASKIAGEFDFIAGCDSGFGAKPAPGPLLAFARSTGLEPARIVMVGDSAHDMLAARAAGMRCVGVLTGPARATDLAPFADAVLPSIGALAEWISTVRAQSA